MKLNDLKLVNQNEKKVEYSKPMIEKVEFDTRSTTVLGNCSGWKDAIADINSFL